MPDIRTSLGIAGAEHDQAIGYVFSAFTLAYALFEIPTGWLGDRFGPRKTLVRVVLWWSFFTAATGWVSGLAALILVRFFFGVGSGVLPEPDQGLLDVASPRGEVARPRASSGSVRAGEEP